jgi:class 3 adenylate cyclase
MRNHFSFFISHGEGKECFSSTARGAASLYVGGVLFSDLRRSTEISELLDATDFIRMLNHYLEEMLEIVNAWQGNILDFVCDSIVVVFGAPPAE